MTQSRSILWRTLGAVAISIAALVYPACVGTPLPDPPSFSELVSWSTTPQADTLRFVGRAGAVAPGGMTIRITDPPRAGAAIVTESDGAFGHLIPGAPGDTFYVEEILASEDHFVGAYTTNPTGGLAPTSAGGDRDGDGSPDAIDCAPDDPAHSGQRCACSVDSDCATGQMCVSGTCVVGTRCTAEVCNGIDDDCDGIVDNGEPSTGVDCAPTGGGCGTLFCDTRSPAPICNMVVGTDHETCGNGIDDDCNGVIDDGCP